MAEAEPEGTPNGGLGTEPRIFAEQRRASGTGRQSPRDRGDHHQEVVVGAVLEVVSLVVTVAATDESVVAVAVDEPVLVVALPAAAVWLSASAW